MTPSKRTVPEVIRALEAMRYRKDADGLPLTSATLSDAIEYLRPLAGTADALDAAIQAAIAGMGEENVALILRKTLRDMGEMDDMIRQVGGTD